MIYDFGEDRYVVEYNGTFYHINDLVYNIIDSVDLTEPHTILDFPIENKIAEFKDKNNVKFEVVGMYHYCNDDIWEGRYDKFRDGYYGFKKVDIG